MSNPVTQPNIYKSASQGRIENSEHNDLAEARKITPAGIVFDPAHIYGNNSATAQFVGKNVSLRVFNNDAAVQYLAVGDSSVTVSGITDGAILPIKAECWFNTGNNEYFITSSNNVQVLALLER